DDRDFAFIHLARVGHRRDGHFLPDVDVLDVALGDVGQHPHGHHIGDGIWGGNIAGLYQEPRLRHARRDAAGDRARHDQDRIDLAIGDDRIDLGLRFAEYTHRIATRLEGALSGLLI